MQYGGHQQQQQQQQQSFNNMGGSMNPLSPTLNLDNLHIFQNTMQAYNQLNKLSHPQMQQQQHQQQDSNILAQQELYHLNQELLNRLKNLNVTFQPPTPTSSTFSASNNNNYINNNNNYIQENPNSFVFTNTNAQNYLNNNSTNNIMTSSPMGTLNRSSSTYSTISPLDDNMCLSFDRSLDNINNNNDSHFIKPLSQLGNITTLEADGKVKVIVPVQQEQDRRYRNNPNDRNDDFFERGGGGGSYNSLQRPQPQQHRALTPILSRSDKKVTLPGTVTLKVTDESGNVTNQRKLPAQPSFITRSTSEKVPNRSQMMSHVQRTQWARHTTK